MNITTEETNLILTGLDALVRRDGLQMAGAANALAAKLQQAAGPPADAPGVPPQLLEKPAKKKATRTPRRGKSQPD